MEEIEALFESRWPNQKRSVLVDPLDAIIPMFLVWKKTRFFLHLIHNGYSFTPLKLSHKNTLLTPKGGAMACPGATFVK
jgi:hypothetical protein